MVPPAACRVLIALDKLKHSLDAGEACEAVAQVIRDRRPHWQLDLAPLTDGGEGFCRILTEACGGRIERVPASLPLPPARGERSSLASVGTLALERLCPAARRLLALPPGADGELALVEMASASGLSLVPEGQRDVWRATSLGTGELIAHASQSGPAAILIGVGGSATSDLGLGALCALGVHLVDAHGKRHCPPLPVDWPRLRRVEGRPPSDLPPLRIACDVDSPLLGSEGAAAVYGPQKGLAPGQWPRLDAETRRLALLLCEHFEKDPRLRDLPGAGAAGGIAHGLMVATGATLVPGFDLVSAWLDLETRIQRADWVLTGEGRFDAGSRAGKGPYRLAQQARDRGRHCRLFAGSIAGDAPPWVQRISPPELPLERAIAQGRHYLQAAVDRWLSETQE